MDREKLIKQLFVGKVTETIGIEKTASLLREATIAIDEMLKSRKAEQVQLNMHNVSGSLPFVYNEKIKQFIHHGDILGVTDVYSDNKRVLLWVDIYYDDNLKQHIVPYKQTFEDWGIEYGGILKHQRSLHESIIFMADVKKVGSIFKNPEILPHTKYIKYLNE